MRFQSAVLAASCLAILCRAQDCNKKSIGSLRWINGTNLAVRGRAFSGDDVGPASPYSRLPLRAHSVVRSPIWGESRMSAGLFVQFATDASCIFVNYTLLSSSISEWHFPSTGVAGVDLYGWDEGNSTWRWTGTSSPKYPVPPVTHMTCSAHVSGGGGSPCTRRGMRRERRREMRRPPAAMF